jgi:hypothetical protein
MKMRLALACLLVVAMLPLAAAAETWSNAPLLDQNCSTKYTLKDADTHTRGCALSCGSSGFGILASNGTFLKFDSAGTKMALAALKASSKKDHIRATVTGERENDMIKVQSVKLD